MSTHSLAGIRFTDRELAALDDLTAYLELHSRNGREASDLYEASDDPGSLSSATRKLRQVVDKLEQREAKRIAWSTELMRALNK